MNPADTLEGKDRYHKMTGARRELPDNRVYGLFFAMEPAIVSTLYMGKASGRGCLPPCYKPVNGVGRGT